MENRTERWYILADSKEDRELRRLELVQADYDFYSQARLTALGAGAGACCLEAGVGAGSMARWMKSVAGPSGRVVAVDVSDRYFGLNEGHGIDLVHADINEVELPEASFDFVHARCFMMHLSRPEDVLQRFSSWLKPGGWVVLCDWDFSFPQRVRGPGSFYNEACDKVAAVVAAHGADLKIGLRLPYLLADAGFVDIDCAGAFPVVLPWNNQPEFLPLSVEVARPALQLDEDGERRHVEFLESLPGSIDTGHTLVMSWARRPPI